MNESWLDRNQNKIFFGMLGVLFFICIFAFLDLRVFASSDPSIVTSVLPYNPNISENGLTEAELNIIQSSFDDHNINHNIYTEPCIIFRNVEGAWYDYSTYGNLRGYTVYFITLDSYSNLFTTWSTNTNFENFAFDDPDKYLDFNIGSNGSYSYYSVRRRNILSINGWQTTLSIEGSSERWVRCFGSYTPTTVACADGSDYTFVPNYPSYVSCPFVTSDINYNTHEFLTNYTRPTASTGHATPPSGFEDTGHSITGSPSSPPVFPTINPHNPSVYNPPTIDTSTLETLVESVHDLIQYNHQYLTNFLSGYFQWIAGIISDIGDYIVDNILYIAQVIVNNIQTGFKNLYYNFVSLFEPLLNAITEYLFNILDQITEYFNWVKERVEYANEPIDYNRIDAYWQETKIYELEDSVSTFCDDLIDTVTNVVPPQRLEFSVDFSNGPWPFNLCGRMYFNFDFYENIRHTIVPWILAFMYVGVVLSLIQQIPNILHGIAGLGFSTQQAHVEHMNNAEWFGYNWTHSFDGSGYIGMGGGGVPSTYRNVNGWYGNWREI